MPPIIIALRSASKMHKVIDQYISEHAAASIYNYWGAASKR